MVNSTSSASGITATVAAEVWMRPEDSVSGTLFGGKKIPELMRGLGKGVKSFKEGVNEAKDEINKAKEEVDKPVDNK